MFTNSSTMQNPCTTLNLLEITKAAGQSRDVHLITKPKFISHFGKSIEIAAVFRSINVFINVILKPLSILKIFVFFSFGLK